MNTAEKINEYGELKSGYEALLREFEAKHEALLSEIARLESEIKSEVLEAGTTVEGNKMMAVWNSGKLTWDGKQLKKFAEKFPEIAVASKTGKPFVSFRRIDVEGEAQ